MSRKLSVISLGRIGYNDAQRLQQDIALDRISGAQPDDVLLLLEHPPVITIGRTSKPEHVVASPKKLEECGVDLFEIDRGGDVTFHGPGQLVGYLIYDLKDHRQDLHWFLRRVEEALIETLKKLGIKGIRKDGLTGVWVEDRKIASIGIHVKQWVTWHGFALNVSTDLSNFDLIIPCGIQNVHMTNVLRESGEARAGKVWDKALEAAASSFAVVFKQEVQWRDHPLRPSSSP